MYDTEVEMHCLAHRRLVRWLPAPMWWHHAWDKTTCLPMRSAYAPGAGGVTGRHCEGDVVCVNHCGAGPCSRRCQVCLRLAWMEGPPCPACPDWPSRSAAARSGAGTGATASTVRAGQTASAPPGPVLSGWGGWVTPVFADPDLTHQIVIRHAKGDQIGVTCNCLGRRLIDARPRWDGDIITAWRAWHHGKGIDV